MEDVVVCLGEEPLEPKYPDVHVQLTGKDGNAMSIMARVRQAMRRAGISFEEQEAFVEEATSGDYDNVLITAMRWVDVD